MTTPIRHARRVLAIAGVAAMLLATPSAAADDKDEGWQDKAEFSYVATSGNTETNTLGFKNKLWRKWTNSAFELNAGGIRVETTTTTRFATGTVTNYDVHESSSTDLTAESYFLNGRYDRKITEKFFWFAGAGWDRNTFAGIDNRYTGFGGVGNQWVDTEKVKFRTDYSLTYTKEDDVVSDPNFDDTFLGARFSWTYFHKFGENTTYGNDLVINENLDETSDWRGDMTNWVSVAMNSRLALKVSLQWLYDNDPSLELIDLLGTTQQVTAELDELDTVFTASVVVNF